MRRGPVKVGAILAAAFLLGAFGSVALALEAGAASPRSSAGGVTLTVSVGDQFSFSLSTNEVQPGQTVTVVLVELGTTAHTFTLSPIPNFQFNSSDSAAHLLDFFTAHPPLVNLSVDGLQTGEKVSQTFTAPAYGLYEYVCLESGHFSQGMYGQLGSGEQGSGGATPVTGPGWQVFAIGGGIAALVITTIVLGFVLGQRPGTKHEMAPERLGYPEESPSESSAPPGH
jgi:plastocyanin